MTDHNDTVETDEHRHDTISETPPDATEGTNRLLDRRDYLKVTGAAALAGVGATSGAAAADYETVPVGAGEKEVRRLGDNDTLENILFDITAPGARVKIRPVGSGWVVRNIGFKGRLDLNGAGPKWYMIGPEVTEGGTGLIENVYLGDGATNDGGTGIFVPLEHAGTLKIRQCYFQHWADNAVYGSAPGRNPRNPGYGSVQIEQCYARNNNLSNFRVGTNGSYVRDSVIRVDKKVPYAYGNPDARNSRGIWVKEGGNVTIENCDILLEHESASYCVVENDNDETGLAKVRNSQIDARGGGVQRFGGNVDVGSNVGQTPDVSVPTGVPQSAQDAANGGNNDDGDDDDSGGGDGLPNRITMDGKGPGLTNYSFNVSGDLEQAPPSEGEDSIDPDGDSITAAVGNGGTDAFRFSGEIGYFNYSEGDILVTVNGTVIDDPENHWE